MLTRVRTRKVGNCCHGVCGPVTQMANGMRTLAGELRFRALLDQLSNQ